MKIIPADKKYQEYWNKLSFDEYQLNKYLTGDK